MSFHVDFGEGLSTGWIPSFSADLIRGFGGSAKRLGLRSCSLIDILGRLMKQPSM